MTSLSLQLGRFASVGSLATLVHVGLASIANMTGAAGPFAANLIGFAGGAATSYLGNYHWTFAGGGDHARSLFRFAVMAAINLCWTNLVVAVAEHQGWPFYASLAVILMTVPPMNFALSKAWVFRRERPASRGFLDIALLIASSLAAAWFYASGPLNHDTSWYLVATERWLDGQRLYHDIVEINPPLAFFLTAPSILVARASGWSSSVAFVLVACATVAAVLLWCRRLLARTSFVTRFEQVTLLAAAFVALAVLPIANFGQREHLMLILVAPYLFLSAFRPQISRRERIAIGAVAVLGLALKPYFLLMPACIGLMAIIRERRFLAPFTPEHWTIGIGCLAYAAFVWLAYPVYFETILPVGALVYGSYGLPAGAVVDAPTLLTFGLLLALLYSLFDGSDRAWAGAVLAAAAVGLLLAYFIQFKGWGYQRMPAGSAMALTLVWLGLLFWGNPRRSPRSILVPATSLGLAGLSVVLLILFGRYESPAAERLGPYLERLEGERSFLAMTTNVSVSFPLANLTGAVVTSRYPALWLIPGAVAKLGSVAGTRSAEERAALEDILDTARRTTTDDLLAGRPRVVFVDVQPDKSYFRGVTFDYLAFFMEDVRFREAWRSYRLVDTVGGFQVWQRSDGGN